MKYGFQKGFVSNANNRNGGDVRKPLRSAKELADEFGITLAQLGGYMKNHDGPAPVISSFNRNTQEAKWFDPAQMRKWWKDLQSKKKGT